MASVIVVGKRKTREVPLGEAVTVVGRDAGAGLELGDLQVSRRHALLVAARQGYFVKDLGSRNGVLLNDQRVASRQQAPLKNGDVLSLGRTTLIFKDVAADVAGVADGDAGGGDEPARPTRMIAAMGAGAPLELALVAEELVAPAGSSQRVSGTPQVPHEGTHQRSGAGAPRGSGGAPPPTRPAPGRDEAREAIPRALAPATYAAPAEVYALRALLDSAERDRAYYRNLSLVLLCLLVGALVLLFLGALRQRDGQRVDAAPAVGAEDGVTGGGAAGGEVRVGGVSGAEAPATRPAAQPLACGIAGPAAGRVGEALALDGEVPAGADLRWTVLERPEGSEASLEGSAASPSVGLTPDRPGRYVIALVARSGERVGSARHSLEAAAAAPAPAPAAPPPAAVAPDPRRERQVERAFQALLGRAPRADEQAALARQESPVRAHLLAQPELYSRWWDDELRYLELTGADRPQGEPWTEVPARLRDGALSVADVHYALAASGVWAQRHPAPEPALRALLSRLLGPIQGQDEALLRAGLTASEGQQTTFLGRAVDEPAEVAGAIVEHPDAVRHLLWRAHRAFTGAEPEQAVLDEGVARLRDDPRAFFAVVVDWCCRGL